MSLFNISYTRVKWTHLTKQKKIVKKKHFYFVQNIEEWLKEMYMLS